MAAARKLSTEALPLIERYSLMCVRWRVAEQHLAAEGEVIAAKRSGVAQINPWLGISRTTAAQLAKLEKDLGLTPGSRVFPMLPLRVDGTPASPRRLAGMPPDEED
jgi:P27 family predicted phage terminase small subunit